MINVSSAWHRALFNDNRNYIEQIKLTLQDNTVINLTNENIWGGAKFDDAVSGDSDFQIGAAIVNKLIFNINNIYDDFSEYDFGSAKVEAKIGLVTDEGTEIIKKGTYTVNSASYNGSLINLECYDYMAKFEKPYSDSTLVYPATLDTIVRGACTDCGVLLQTLDFPHKTFVIQERPDDDNCSYREIIAWCAQIAGCFARCNVDGKLELKWYDQDAINNVVGDLDGGIFDNGTPSYTSGDTADGGTFNPWNTGYVHDSGSFTDSIRAHHIDSLYSHDISVDDVIITGIRILVNSTGTNPIEPVLVGTLGYVIEISNNPLITTTNASQIATWLGTQLIGFTFRKAQISHGSDPSIEAGDVAFVIDGKARTYPIVISHTVFAVGSAQSTTSSAQTPARNSAQRYGTETKNYVELRKALKSEKTAREQAEDDLADAIANANGLYETTIVNEVTGATTYYLHNKQQLSDSAIRIMISDVGITVTADGGQHWYGLTASGDMITHLLSATGINADWITTGQLIIEDAQHNETFFADADSGVVRIAPTQFTLTPANQQYIQNTANNAASGAVSAFENGDFATFVTNTNTVLGTKITTYYQSSAPTANVVGDLWIDTDDHNKLYRWNGTTWQDVRDTDIQAALTAAGDAQSTADSKIITFAQTTQPTATDVGDLWIDTDDANKLYRWNGSQWRVVTDSSALNAFTNGTYANFVTATNQSLAKKVTTFYQSTTPTNAISGDLWIDGGNGNILKRYDGSSWVAVQDEGIQSALTAAGDAQSTADRKIVTYAQSSTPTGTLDTGDLWIDTDDDNKMYRWNGSSWARVTDSSALNAFVDGSYATFVTDTTNAINGKITTFYQSTAPTTNVVGDLWVDTTNNSNELKRWNGTTWTSVQDAGIQKAITDAGDAQATADRKIVTYAQATAPTGTTTVPLDIGDLWIDTDDNNKLYRYNGQSWLPYTDSSALQTWITGTYASDKSDLQTQIDGKIQTWRQDEDPVVTEGWSDSATKAKHKGDIWYCTSEDIIPSWLSSYVNTETGMTALVSSRVDDGWYEISNAVNFTIDGATSTNIYIDTNSVFAFADAQPSTSGRNQAYNLNICRRDGQAMSIKYQVIESGSNKAVKVRYNGYTEYQQSYQTEEYANEYEVFFTNANEIYINTIKQPTHTYTSGLIDTSIKDSGTTVSFSLIADTHASIKKVNGAWVANIDQYSGKSWMYDLVNGAYSWQVMDSGVPEELLDEIDGKSSIYTTASAPTDAQEGDLWFKGVSDPIKTYHNGQWVEYNKYTDDTAANAYTDSKISTYDTNLNQQAVFNKLTNNGSAQGIFIENGNLYINMSYLKTGTLVAGGSNNASGIILMKNSSGNTYGRWDNAGIKLGGSGDTQTSPNTTISTSGVIEVSFGSSKYARMSPTNGFEVQGNKIKAKLYASEWTYQSTDSFNPDSENPDLGPNDPDLRPGFLGLNTAIKITDTNNYLGTYTAVGKNYVEIGYSAQDYVAPDLITMRSTSNGSYLRIVKKGNDLDYMKEMVLGESGFKRFYNATAFNNHWRYTPVTSTLTIGNTTYYCIGGILCRATD